MGSDQGAHGLVQGPHGLVQGPHVLVMEHEMITGLGLAEDLLDLGYRVSGPFIDEREILSLLAHDAPDYAIVDLAVEDGGGLAAARALRRRGVPLVFFSAGDRRRYVDGEFGDVPWVDKPAATDRLLVALGIRRSRDLPQRAAGDEIDGSGRGAR